MLYDIPDRKQLTAGLFLPTTRTPRKNLLAIVLSITSGACGSDAAEAREVLIRACMLSHQSRCHNGGLDGAPRRIVRLELEPFSTRVEATGPHVMLNPRVAQTFALLLHELATNAAKHGALSGPDGRIEIHWVIEGVGEQASFAFRWHELDGPPVVRPTRQGFGRILLEKAATQEFGVAPKVTFAPDGLSYEIDALLSDVAATSELLVETI